MERLQRPFSKTCGFSHAIANFSSIFHINLIKIDQIKAKRLRQHPHQLAYNKSILYYLGAFLLTFFCTPSVYYRGPHVRQLSSHHLSLPWLSIRLTSTRSSSQQCKNVEMCGSEHFSGKFVNNFYSILRVSSI